MRATWTDSRLDDLKDRVQSRLDELSGRVTDLSDRVDAGFARVDGRIDSLQHAIVLVGGALVVAFVGLIATQL